MGPCLCIYDYPCRNFIINMNWYKSFSSFNAPLKMHLSIESLDIMDIMHSSMYGTCFIQSMKLLITMDLLNMLEILNSTLDGHVLNWPWNKTPIFMMIESYFTRR